MSPHGHGSEPDRARRGSLVLPALKRLSPRRRSTWFRWAFVVAVCTTSCVDAVAVVSDHPTTPAVKLTQLTDAFAARFTAPERSGRFETARRRLVSGSLLPSRVFNDSSIWSATIPPAGRLLTARGTLTDRGYRFEVAPASDELHKPADTHHSIALHRLSDSEYRWDTGVEFAIGSVTASDVGAMLVALLANGDGRDAAVVRAGARTSFPRSSAVLGKVFSIDSLSMRPGGQGTTTVTMVLGIRPDGLRTSSPHFADYITRYVAKSRYRFTLADKIGATYFEMLSVDQRVVIRYRVKGDAIVTSLGPPREMPDSLRFISDFSMHIKMFDVGWKGLVTDFTIHRTEHSRTWTIVAQSEPDWQLPLITERVLRTPLRRPFQGAGASFDIGVVDSVGVETILSRHVHLEVKESTILRFIGGLVSRVFDDMDAVVEREEAAYVRELMMAFQQDVLHPSPR